MVSDTEDSFELTEVEIAHCNEGFQLFDLDGDGLMKPEEFKDYMAALTIHPSDVEIYQFFEDNKVEDKFVVNVNSVMNYIHKYLVDTRDENRLREALKVFDHEDTGFVLAAEIKYMLMNYGNKLSEEEVTALFREVTINDDSEIRFEEIIEALRPVEYEIIVDDYTDSSESSSENESDG